MTPAAPSARKARERRRHECPARHRSGGRGARRLRRPHTARGGLGRLRPVTGRWRVARSASCAVVARQGHDGGFKTDWEPRAPADLVGWSEAHPADRRDLYLDDDALFIAEELYCVNPTCPCSEAMVAFSPITRGSPDVGALRVRIPTLEIVERDVHPKRAARLDRLWNAFSARHRQLSERLAERNKQMLDLASAHAPPRTPATRAARDVGRNQPCPCGSGKKYKRCCGL